MKNSADNIILQIEEAFSEVSRNDGTTLHEAMALDDRKAADSVKLARAKDSEKHWSQVPRKNLSDYESALSFMNPEGFRYYIPVFMIAALEGTGDEHSPFYHLTKSLPEAICRECDFTGQQVAAIVAFIEYLADEGTVEDMQSLQAWKSYLSTLENQ